MAVPLAIPEVAAAGGCAAAPPGVPSRSRGCTHDDLPARARSEGQAAAAAAAAAASDGALPSLQHASSKGSEADLEDGASGGGDGLPVPGCKASLAGGAPPGPASQRSLSSRAENVGTLATTANVASAVLGASFAALPYSFGRLGWSSVVALPAIGGVTALTAVLLGRCASAALGAALEKGCRAADWPSIGRAAFGEAGQAVVTSVLTGELFSGMVAYLVINGSALQLLLPSCSRTWLIRLSGCASLVLTFCPPEFLGYFSALGLLALLLVAALLAATGAALPERPAARSYEILQPAAASTAISSFLFCFLCHGSIPSMYATMERKAKFPLAVSAAFVVSVAVFVAAGALGYYFFAGSLQQDVLDNVGRDLALAPLPGLRWMPLLGSGALALKLQATFPLMAAPIVDVGEGLLESLAAAEQMPRTLRALLRLGLLAAVTALAEALQDHVSACVALAGSLFATCTALIFPALFYYRLHAKEVSRARACLLGAIGLGGVYSMVAGTYSALREIAGA